MFIIKLQSQFMYKDSILAAILNLAGILRHVAVILIINTHWTVLCMTKKKQFLFLLNK